jgi:hypothetical protein
LQSIDRIASPPIAVNHQPSLIGLPKADPSQVVVHRLKHLVRRPAAPVADTEYAYYGELAVQKLEVLRLSFRSLWRYDE